MLWMLSLRKKMVFIPTTCRMTAGIYSAEEPIAAIPYNDKTSIISLLKQIIEKGNPIIPTPKRSEYKDPPVLKYAGVKTWSQFERIAIGWNIKFHNNIYIVAKQCKASTRGWIDDPDATKVFPEGTSIDEVAEYVADQIQLIA